MSTVEPSGSASRTESTARAGTAKSKTTPGSAASALSVVCTRGTSKRAATRSARSRSMSKRAATGSPSLRYAGRCALSTTPPAPTTAMGRGSVGRGQACDSLAASAMRLPSHDSRSGGMTAKVRDRVIVVTGGASGIGEATVRLFAAEGAIVHIVDLDGEGARRTVEAVIAGGGRAHAHEADVADAARVDQVFRDVVAHSKRLDALVNCAAVAHVGTLLSTDES